MLTPIKEKVLNEGAEIYCERRGNGPILLLIHGAMEDAGIILLRPSLQINLLLCHMIGDVTLSFWGSKR